jgi:V/A-type H+-transporting ATPase subunit I
MLVPMRRVDVVIPRVSVGAALRAIHRAGLLHLVPFDPPDDVGPVAFHHPSAVPAPRFRQALEAVLEVAGLLPQRGPANDLVAQLWDLPDDGLLARVDAIRPVRDAAGALTGERVRLGAEIARRRDYRRLIEGLRHVVGRLPAVRGYAATGIVISARYQPVLTMLRDELDSMTGDRCELVAGHLDGERIGAVLVYPARLSGEVATLLGRRDLEEVALPPSLTGVPFDELVPRLTAEEDELERQLQRVEGELEALAATHAAEVAALRSVLEDRVAEVEAVADAGAAEHVTVLSGWVPATRVDALRASLQGVAGPPCLVVERELAGERSVDAPVAMANRGVIRPFEPLASFVALPRYGTLDPTPALAITLPAFIGLMVGDAGYGLVLLGLLAFARRRWGALSLMQTLWPVGLATGVATIAFGILFGEFFGATGHHLFGLEPLWFDRREGVVQLLLVALAIGVAQVVLGLVLGVVNGVLMHERREIVPRVALLVSLAASLALLGVAARVLPHEVGLIAGAGLVLGFVLVLFTIGITGPIELIGVFGNVLSYARIMAIGLAGVMLAVVADELGSAIPNLVLGALVAGLFHALNIGLGFFDASIQGIRLHYVEFFSKFVEPGGTPYRPFTAVISSAPATTAASGG